MKGHMECDDDDTDEETRAILEKKNPRRFKLLLKVAMGVGGITMVTNPALFWAEPSAISRHVEHNGQWSEQLARTPGRSQLRGVPSRSIDAGKGTAEVLLGVTTASDNPAEPLTGADVAQDAATPSRLRTLPMKGRWREWIISPMAGDKPEEGGNDGGHKDWPITHKIDADDDADDDASDYYAVYARLKDFESTPSGHGRGGVRNDNVGDRRQQHEDGEEELKSLKARFANDGNDVFGDAVRSGYHSRHAGRVVPWGEAEDEGGIDAESERSELRKNDGRLGTSKGSSGAMVERSLDFGKHDYKTARGGDTELDARKHRGRQAIEGEEEEMGWSTDDDGVLHHAHTNRVSALHSGPRPDVFPSTLDQLDNRDGLWAEGERVEKLGREGGKHREQGVPTTNLNPKSTVRREKDFPNTDESEVLLRRRRHRRPDEHWEEDSELSATAWSQPEDDKYVVGTWDTDDDFLIHVAHYAKVAKGDQHGTPAAGEPARRSRQWERARESLWDTDDDVLFYEESHHDLGAARGAVSDVAVVDMPAAPVHKEARAWESEVVDESDDSPLDDVSGVPSTPKETGQEQTALPEVADKHLVGWEFNDDFEYYDYPAHYDYRDPVTSGDRGQDQGSDIADDWELDAGKFFLEKDQMLTAAAGGHGGPATAAEEEEQEVEGGNSLLFGSSSMDDFERFAYDYDATPAAGGVAVPPVGVEEEKQHEEEKRSNEPYTEYYSYIAEMKLLQQEAFGRSSTDVQQQQEPQSSKRHAVKTATSVVDTEQRRKRPLEKQVEEWGRLGLLINPLLEFFSAGEERGALGFVESLLPRKLSDSRDEAITGGEKAQKEPQARAENDELTATSQGTVGADAVEFALAGVAEVARKLRGGGEGRPPSTGSA